MRFYSVPAVLLAGLLSFFAGQALAAQEKTPEAMQAASAGCESCLSESSSCVDLNQSPFSLPLRDVYVTPKGVAPHGP